MSERSELTPASGGADGLATLELWTRLERPFDPARAVEALVGLPSAAARHLAGLRLATCTESDGLLDRMHEIVRSLAIATTMQPVRTTGELRGPVLWAETVAARSASPGANGVFICASPSKAYDTEENRVLVSALLKIRDAARSADHKSELDPDHDLVRRARHNGNRAIRNLDHRTLAGVSRERVDGRAVQKARRSKGARSYRLAIALLDRAHDPIEPEDLMNAADDDTGRRHRLFLDLADRLKTRGFDTAVRLDETTLRAGPLRYRHQARSRADGWHGILVGDLLVDVVPRRASGDPDAALAARSGGRRNILVRSQLDLDYVAETFTDS